MSEEKLTIIDKMLAHVVSECREVDREERFDQMLDECYSFEKVGGPFSHMSPSRVLKEVDPIAYRCGVNDYEDSDNLIEINGDYYEKDDVEAAREEFIEELESEVLSAQEDIEEELKEEFPNEELIEGLRGKLSDFQEQIKEAKEYSF